MFASWQPIANDDGSVLLSERPHTFNPVTAKTERPVACSLCRAQKVHCTGGSSCRRCQTLGRTCTYPPRRCSTATSTTPAPGNALGSLVTEQWLSPDSLETLTPAPTEDSGEAVSTSFTHYGAHDRNDEAHGRYSSETDFFAFPLDQDFTLSPAAGPLSNSDVQSRRLTPGPEQSLPRCGQHWGNYPQSRVMPQADAQCSHQTQGRADPSQSDCRCLHGVVLLIDELELITERDPNANLPVDGVLSAHRKALCQAERMLACRFSAARVENMTILTFLVGRLTDLCCRACASEPSPPSATQPHRSEALGLTTVIGAFRVESETERVAIVRVLMRLRLDRLLELISVLQGVGRRLGSEAMGRRLDLSRRAVGGLLNEMERS